MPQAPCPPPHGHPWPRAKGDRGGAPGGVGRRATGHKWTPLGPCGLWGAHHFPTGVCLPAPWSRSRDKQSGPCSSGPPTSSPLPARFPPRPGQHSAFQAAPAAPLFRRLSTVHPVIRLLYRGARACSRGMDDDAKLRLLVGSVGEINQREFHLCREAGEDMSYTGFRAWMAQRYGGDLRTSAREQLRSLHLSNGAKSGWRPGVIYGRASGLFGAKLRTPVKRKHATGSSTGCPRPSGSACSGKRQRRPSATRH